MRVLERVNNEEYTIIIGCGRLGSNIANTLSNEGENVLIIDDNQDSFKRLASNFGGLTVVGDGTDLDILKEAKISKATTVIVVTNDDNVNLMIAQMSRDIFKVEKVIARLYDLERESIYQELGVNTICPSMLSANEIKSLLKGGNSNEKE